MNRLVKTVLVLGLGITASCGTEYQAVKGFSLPEGDPTQGQEVFTSMQCNSCHKLPGIAQLEWEEHHISVPLGGEVTRIETYGELVTSVINPSHRIARAYQEDYVDEQGQSMMMNYNDVMTVTQLVDLVAFLQDQYELKEREYHTSYPHYYP